MQFSPQRRASRALAPVTVARLRTMGPATLLLFQQDHSPARRGAGSAGGLAGRILHECHDSRPAPAAMAPQPRRYVAKAQSGAVIGC
jgi:hypothetical protein